MADDVLILGGIAFDQYSTPAKMGAGGQQAMVVHKLPGGSRVIDLLGPDEDDIHWHGEFFADDALQTALALDAMRASGGVFALTFAGQFRSVIIKHFKWDIRRLPVWVEYEIVVTVAVNPSLGNVTPSANTIDILIAADLLSAGSLP